MNIEGRIEKLETKYRASTENEQSSRAFVEWFENGVKPEPSESVRSFMRNDLAALFLQEPE